MQNLLNLNYWFDMKPPYFTSGSEKIYIIFLLFLICTATLFFILKRKKGFYKKIFEKFYSFSISNLIVGIFLLFFRYERASFLSGRFWMGLWFILMLVWGFFILKNINKIPEKIKKAKQQKEKNKYIP